MGRGSVGTFDGFGNLTKALTFSPERAACVAECRVSKHAGLIHAFDTGHDPGPQQQSTLFDQLGHFREVQLGIAEGLRGSVLGGLGYGRILRVHLLHGLFQSWHVIDHRKAFKRRRPATRVPAEPANALESDFTHEICHIQESPAETIDPWNESLTSLERSNTLKNSGIGRRFKGNAQWLAASWAHPLLPSTIVPHGRDC